MVDLMSSIICEGDTVSQELLDTVLVNLVPAHKVRARRVDARELDGMITQKATHRRIDIHDGTVCVCVYMYKRLSNGQSEVSLYCQ